MIECSIIKGVEAQEAKLRSETQLEDKLAKAWEETSARVKELLAHRDSEVLAKLADIRAVHVTKVLEHLEVIDKELNALNGAKLRETELKRSQTPVEPTPKPEATLDLPTPASESPAPSPAPGRAKEAAEPSTPSDAAGEEGYLCVQKVSGRTCLGSLL